jgi:membrane protein YqaA with SNARE-associated domain
MGLFMAAFAAATLLPAQSEAAFVGLLLTETYSPAILLVVASVGNTVGAAVNWILGRIPLNVINHSRLS